MEKRDVLLLRKFREPTEREDLDRISQYYSIKAVELVRTEEFFAKSSNEFQFKYIRFPG
ncbi:hypothetical protein TSMEX_009348 [Taenia solium]|eukprot:TsM_000650300 transcript=TsM_000650300 gene=TsM_000650300